MPVTRIDLWRDDAFRVWENAKGSAVFCDRIGRWFSLPRGLQRMTLCIATACTADAYQMVRKEKFGKFLLSGFAWNGRWYECFCAFYNALPDGKPAWVWLEYEE